MDDLPKEVDVIVVGTGLTESIVSAAASRNGHTVLHLDPRDYYGGKWTTVNWEGLQTEIFAAKEPSPVKEDEITVEKSDQDLIWSNPIRDVENVWYVNDEDKKTEVSKLSRKFNIDVFPKVLLAREELIQLLIESNVSRYLEFKCITRLFASLPSPQENIIEPIPLSRSDIFTSKSLGLVEKRKLTKFIESILNEEPKQSSDETSTAKTTETPPVKTFDELVQTTKVSEKIQHLIKSAVRTVEDGFDNSDTFNKEFVDRCRLFLRAIGRYGNQTPYLWTLYGIGEVCQAFCRLSAIYGGIFILKRSIQKVNLIKEDSESGGEPSDLLLVKSNDLEIKSKYLVLGPEVKHVHVSKIVKNKTIIRGILLIVGGTLKNDYVSEKGDGNQMHVYKIGNAEIIELDHSSLAVPKPFSLLQVTCPLVSDNETTQMSPRRVVEKLLEPFVRFIPSESPKKDQEEQVKVETVSPTDNLNVEDAASRTVDSSSSSPLPTPITTATASKSSEKSSDGKPSVLYGSYFLVDFHESENELGEGGDAELPNISQRILHCATGSTEITREIQKAREIFQTMYPQEEFLPKAADGSEENAEDNDNDVNEEYEEDGEEGQGNGDGNNATSASVEPSKEVQELETEDGKVDEESTDKNSSLPSSSS